MTKQRNDRRQARIDRDCQVDLAKYMDMYKNPHNTREWWDEFKKMDQRISAIITHRICSPPLLDKIRAAFKEIYPWFLENNPFGFRTWLKEQQ